MLDPNCRNPTLRELWGRNSHSRKMGLWSPSGLPKIQSVISGVKTPRIGTFLVPLERSWSVDVQNGLAWVIWTFITQVMVERRAGSQTGSLTPEHWKSGIDPIPVRAGEVRHTVEKLLRRATTLVETLSRSEFGVRSYERPKSQESKPGQFRNFTLGVPGKRAIWMQVPWRAAENTIWGKVMASPESGLWWIKWVQVARGLSQHQKGAEWILTHLGLDLDAGPCNWVSLSLFLVYPRAFSTPFSPPLVLEAGSGFKSQTTSVIWHSWTPFGSNKGLGSASQILVLLHQVIHLWFGFDKLVIWAQYI